jgi:hypothetical protein
VVGGLPITQNPNPTCRVNFPKLAIAWNNLTVGIEWLVPKGLYWIYGERVYTILPNNWFRSYVLGTIQPSFFLLPLKQGEKLGVSIYEERVNRKKKGALQIGDWKGNEWLPEQIIQYYGPATWAEDGFWDYCTPIYMFNHIIWLQAVVEIITSETAKALSILAKQQTKIGNTIYQNHLALDYLLASEGRVCGKFNLSNCCLQIDDEKKVIEEITDKMK